MNDKICLVVQRYGEEVNGGAELQCRQMAERLKDLYSVEVLTTKAIDYMSWKDEYKEDVEEIHGVLVRRFSVDCPRNIDRFNQINGKFLNGQLSENEEMKWIEEQGPLVPELLEYMVEHEPEYKAILFFTYLYYPSVIGVSKVREKAILVPEAHDEPFLRMEMYKNLFYSPRAFFFNTEEERQLVYEKFENEWIPSDIGGVGIEVPEKTSTADFKQKYDLDEYMVYVGRIDEGKYCHWLFRYFLEYKKRNNNNLKLVLMGKAVIEVPESPDIISLGFVSDEDKYNGVAGAKMLILPSPYESLSMVVLEAMALEIPVLVNGDCEVTRQHCLKSNGGLYYHGYFEFEGAVNYLLSHEKAGKLMGENGKIYVEQNYKWNVIIPRLQQMIEYVSELTIRQSKRPRVFQIVTVLNVGDAIGNDVLAIKQALEEEDYFTAVYASTIHSNIRRENVFPIYAMPELKKDDIVIYHFGTEDPLADLIKKLPCKKVFRYHNVTPPEFFQPYNQNIARNTKNALKQVRELSGYMDYGMVDSEFNKDNLLDMGYKMDIDVVPILIPFDDYAKAPAKSVVDKYNDDWTNILFVGRVAPNKKFEDIITAFAAYKKKYNQKSRLFLVGGYDENDAYFKKLKSIIKRERIKDVIFSGHIPFSEILAYYQIADVFLCMSEHEGFCVPLLEAMYFQVPIIAYGNTAISLTLGDAGVLLDTKKAELTAEKINQLMCSEKDRLQLIENGQKRLEQFQYDEIKKQIIDCIKKYSEQI